MIRRATPDDLPVLLELGAEYAAADHHEFDPTIATSGFAGLLVDDTYGVVWLTESGDAYAVVTWSWSVESGGLEAILDEIYVRQQGRGVGSQLLDHLHADCDRRGVRRIFLETEPHNGDARRLYERHGYVAEPSIWMARAGRRVNSL